MKDITKLVLAGLTGYFIGFYEMKYKTMKEIIKGGCGRFLGLNCYS